MKIWLLILCWIGLVQGNDTIPDTVRVREKVEINQALDESIQKMDSILIRKKTQMKEERDAE